MKNKILSFIVLFTAFTSLNAEILESTQVGPGVTYYHDFRSNGPWHLYILEVDLNNQWIDVETIKSGDLLYAYEKPSSMSKRSDREEHRIVGAINGDFYDSGGIPINAQVLQGELLRRPIEREEFGVTVDKKPFIGIFSFHGTVWCKNGASVPINGVNETRLTDNLIVYNKYMGHSTGTNEWGCEVLAKYIDASAINDTVFLKIAGIDTVMATGHGNNTIPSNGLVLSGHGVSRDFLKENIVLGDTIKMLLSLPPESRAIKELIGGGPALIKDGVVVVPGGSFSTDRHPRTAIGFSQDSTMLYLFVVDGRQSGFSVGMSLFELADYMLEWGVYNGINMDGGGSSAMVVRNAVKNSPSDSGVERSVSNALMIVSKAPSDSLAHIRILPREVYLLTETGKQFQINAFDQYYNPIAYREDLLQWSCPSNLGCIDAAGKFTAGTDTISAFVYANIGDIRDSVLVHVTRIDSIELQPRPVILKIGEKQQIYATALDNYSNVIDLSPDKYSWSVSGDAGSISSTGLFSAEKVGNAEITAEYREITGSTDVSVGVAASVVIDDFDNVNNWSLSGSRVDLNACTISPSYSVYKSFPSSGQLDYRLTTGGTSVLYMNCSVQISGTPDAISIEVYGDGKGHWLRGEFRDRDGEVFLVNFTEADPGIDWSGEWKKLEVSLDNAIASWANPSAVLNYPITWKKIYLAETDEGKKDSGTIFFDDFTIHFIDVNSVNESNRQIGNIFHLERMYPNPFNASSNFQIQLIDSGDITFSFYDINGRLVDKMLLLNKEPGRYVVSWTPSSLPSGIYLYTINMNSQKLQGKCLLIK